MSCKHPTYPNPTIQEALCEIHFALPEGVAWEPTVFGEFYRKIQDKFPQMEPVSQVAVQLQAGPARIEHTVLPARQTMRYRHPSKNLLVQLSEGILTVNVLPVYAGWERMQADILDVWGEALDVIHPQSVKRIGLRYIDFIQRESAGETPGDWLRDSEYLPKAALSSLAGFLSRTEIRVDEETRLIVALGEAGEDPPAIVLDIDCIVEKEITIEAESIAEATRRLHDMESEVFFASVTQRLERRLRGVQA
jgi:uncharacterized protein (TIGR04255 family)